MAIVNVQDNIKIDKNTGEILSHYQTQKHSKVWVDGKGAMLMQSANHSKVYTNNSKTLSNKIKNTTDYGRVMRLIPYVYGKTNYIHKTNTSTVPASIDDIAEIIGLSRRRCITFLNNMKDIGVIGKLTFETSNIKTVRYCFNPVYINSTKYVDLDMYLLWKEYLDDHFPNWVKDSYEEWKKVLSLKE